MQTRFPPWHKGLLSDPVRKDFFVLLVDRVLRISVGLILTALIARHLGPEQFGALNYAGAVVAVGVAFAFLGLDNVAVRDCARSPERTGEIMGAVFAVRLIAGTLVVAIFWLGLTVFGGTDMVQRELIAIVSLTALGPSLAVPALWFQAKSQMRIAVFASWWVFFAVTIVRLCLVHWQSSVVGFAWVSLAEALLGGGVVWIAFVRRKGRLRLRSFMNYATRLLRDGAPLVVGALAGIIFTRVDQITLKWIAGVEAVGIYSAATRMSEAAYAVPALLGVSVMATLSKCSQQSGGMDRVIESYFQTSAALGYLLAIPSIILAPWVIATLFGDGYGEAGSVAQVHLISVVFVTMNVARGRVLIAKGQTVFAMISSLIGCGLSLGLNLVLVPIWSTMGAALAALAAHFVTAIGSTLVYPRTRSMGVSQLRALVRPRFVRLAHDPDREDSSGAAKMPR